MYPISGKGPYYAALMTGGNLDTKGGPATNTDGQVLDSLGAVIPGLYGVGNCVASASGRAYWAGGGTLGPFMAFAYLAANAASREPGSGRAEKARGDLRIAASGEQPWRTRRSASLPTRSPQSRDDSCVSRSRLSGEGLSSPRSICWANCTTAPFIRADTPSRLASARTRPLRSSTSLCRPFIQS